jgi:hypothetical protein
MIVGNIFIWWVTLAAPPLHALKLKSLPLLLLYASRVDRVSQFRCNLPHNSFLTAKSIVGVVQQILALSQDPDAQEHIARESGCLSGLVDFLANADGEVVLTCLHALRHLSSHPNNRAIMSEQPGLLKGVRSRAVHPDGKIVEVANAVLSNLDAIEHCTDMAVTPGPDFAASYYSVPDFDTPSGGPTGNPGSPSGVGSPQYLEPVECFSVAGGTCNGTLVESNHSSLEDRLERNRRRQIKDEHREGKVARFMSKVGTMLSLW